MVFLSKKSRIQQRPFIGLKWDLCPLKNLSSGIYGWELLSEYNKSPPLICVVYPEQKPLPFWNSRYIGWTLKSEKSTSTNLSVWDIPCHKYILRTRENTLIQLQGNSYLVQMECPPDLDLASPLYLDIKTPMGRELKEKSRLLGELYSIIFRPEKITNEENKQRKLQEYLVALDASLNGQSYREIAIKLWGERLVKEDWNGGESYMKSRVRRCVSRGHYYMNGGYLELLKK